MAKLTILRGVAGSGKSTWAEAQAGNPVIVSRDRIRLGIFGTNDQDYYNVSKETLYRKEELVTKVHDAAIVEALRAGSDVIVDNTNVRMKYVHPIAALGHKCGADVELKIIDVPLGTALARNAQRAAAGGRDVPEKIIKEQFQALQGSKDATLPAPQVVRPYNGTPGKPKAFMVDIDGTLAHMRDYRGPFDWAKVGLDDVDHTIANIASTLSYSQTFFGPLTMIVMSGRDEICRDETQKWLDEHLYDVQYLFMRPEGDMRKDNIVKAELFDTHVRDNFDVQFVLDDRPQVIRMWHQIGLKVLDVDPCGPEF